MRSVTWGLRDEPVRLEGAVSTHPDVHGVAVSRLGPTAEAQATDQALLWMGRMPAGARLSLVTDTTAVEVDAHVTRLAVMGEYPFVAAFDLVVDDGEVRTITLSDTAAVNAVDMVTGRTEQVEHPPTTIRFDGLPAGTKHLELWLPHNAQVQLLAVRVDDGAAVAPPEARSRWVHYGSSISHCLEALSPTATWPAIVARRRRLDLVNLALGGQAQLDQFAARTIRQLAPDLVSLKVGINVLNADSMRERTFVPALHGFLDTIRDRLPTTPILVVTPIFCPVAEDHPGPTVHVGPQVGVVERPVGLRPGALTLRRIRELVTEVVDRRIKMGDDHLTVLSGLELFGEGDLDELPDGLHPSPQGYTRIAERFDARAFGPGGVWAGLPADL